ncbi:hypothetical protein AABM34_02665 [Lysinibacillus fusiformis]
MRKKLNIAMLTMLLVFQTLLSPLSVFASEDLSTPPVVNDNGSDDEMEKNPSTPVSNDTDLSEDNIGEEELSTTPQENENKEQDPEVRLLKKKKWRMNLLKHCQWIIHHWFLKKFQLHYYHL